MAASEQSKYTTVLTIFWRTFLGEEDDYVFVPALRLSASDRYAPTFGTDAVKDSNDTDGTAAVWVSLWANGSATRSCSPW
jgi:hypothetical protein